MDGVLVVDKPEGPTSHDVVARTRRALGIRSVGHTGTLDPMATGVLVLLLGRATRLARFLALHRKTYDATARLGLVTDTWDRTGAPLPSPGAPLPSLAQVENALVRFVGVHPQLPPPYSAKKRDGVPSYKTARRGGVVSLEPVSVQLHEARVTGGRGPLVLLALVTSAGFYVRSLVHELGQGLGCGATLEALRRTASGDFDVAEAVGLEQMEREPSAAAARVVPMDRLLPDLPSFVLDDATAGRACHGNEVEIAGAAGQPLGEGPVRLMAPDGSLLAIARTTGRPGVLHPAVVLK